MVFDENTLYAGLVGDMTLAAALTSYTGGTGDPKITVLDPGTLTFGKVSEPCPARYTGGMGKEGEGAIGG